jgi:hypothetical protein
LGEETGDRNVSQVFFEDACIMVRSTEQSFAAPATTEQQRALRRGVTSFGRA